MCSQGSSAFISNITDFYKNWLKCVQMYSKQIAHNPLPIPSHSLAEKHVVSKHKSGKGVLLEIILKQCRCKNFYGKTTSKYILSLIPQLSASYYLRYAPYTFKLHHIFLLMLTSLVLRSNLYSIIQQKL